jgi:hypothetical protein
MQRAGFALDADTFAAKRNGSRHASICVGSLVGLRHTDGVRLAATFTAS